MINARNMPLYGADLFVSLLIRLILCAFVFHCWGQFPSIVNIYYFFPVSALETLYCGGDLKEK